MSTATLAVTISLAAIFGAALLWIAIYHLHKYIHRECCKIRDFFTSLVWTEPKQEDYAHERGEPNLRHSTPEEWMREEERHRVSELEWERAERDVEERKREREVRKREKVRKKVEEWEDGDGTGTEGATSSMSKMYMPPSVRRHEIAQGHDGGSGQGFFLQPCIPTYVPAFVPVLQPYGTHYLPVNLPHPVLPSDPDLGVGDDGQHVDYELPPLQSYTNGTENELNSPAQPYLDTEGYLSPIVESEDEVVGASVYERPASEQPMPRTDFISINVEYPTFVRDSLEEGNNVREYSSKDGSSSSGSWSSSADEEVPRGPIPSATQRPTFHFPQMPWRTHPPNIPRSYPRQCRMPPVEPFPDDVLTYPPYANMGRNSRRTERRFVPKREWRRSPRGMVQEKDDYDYDAFPNPLPSWRLDRERRWDPRPPRARGSGCSRYRLPRQPRRRSDAAGQPVTPLSPDEVLMGSAGERMVSPAEVEEPLDTTQAPHDESGPANNIEVEEVVQHTIDDEVAPVQVNPVEKQPNLLGMPPSMAQHDPDVASQEASPPVPVEQQEAAFVDVENVETKKRASPEMEEEQVPASGLDEQPDDGTAGQETILSPAREQSEKQETSPSTIVSSLHVSAYGSVGRNDRSSGGNDSPVSGDQQEGSMGSDIISSFALEQWK
ncbi:hypothetical protein PMIN01_05473 [Paraphaeosphaeria minitans]|uniref:Uncharacterized protein n=1 Tax=Paraphaeosphaeria minitans TaxID=565426 RepID=A0A9P6KTF2_9PLEO|nr:hypothetical protein PMIN01_05473 [Paraphaeosphaeria minitans]